MDAHRQSRQRHTPIVGHNDLAVVNSAQPKEHKRIRDVTKAAVMPSGRTEQCHLAAQIPW